jgi:hypothetical protein
LDVERAGAAAATARAAIPALEGQRQVSLFEPWYTHTKERNAQARELFLRASELDPGFAAAWGWLATAHINDYVSQWTASP